MGKLPQDFEDFLNLLNEQEVRYLLVGRYAVAWYGFPRSTANIDIWVERSLPNAERVVAVLKDFGFHSPELCKEMFLDPDRMTRLGESQLRSRFLIRSQV